MIQTNGKTNQDASDQVPDFRDCRERSAWVVYQLRLKGKSLTSLSAERGFARTTVAQGLHYPYPKMEKIIAAEIGVNPEMLFPERYEMRRLRHA